MSRLDLAAGAHASSRLDDHLAALDAFATRDDVALAGATRLRIRASLERGHAWRRHASLLAALAVLLVASASWALATGRLRRWFAPPRVLHSALPATATSTAPATRPAPATRTAPAPTTSPAPATRTAPAPTTSPAPATRAAPARTTPPTRAPDASRVTTAPPVRAADEPDPLYTRAHELHFHGTDPAAALAAWDAYLAAEPTGAFAVEARYHRALCLVLLGRLADARRELAPFAHGDVEPRGYRQPDAAK
ncbi:MAG TPA: hypothetical protein VLT45_12430, partial [Kofleriaceae bacterium]|nr:hypothetical protein [Kofleriaceae bacterium]